jgi:hypothetical protein
MGGEFVEDNFAEEVEEVRIRLRLTVYVARFIPEGLAYHEEFPARYGVSRDE